MGSGCLVDQIGFQMPAEGKGQKAKVKPAFGPDAPGTRLPTCSGHPMLGSGQYVVLKVLGQFDEDR